MLIDRALETHTGLELQAFHKVGWYDPLVAAARDLHPHGTEGRVSGKVTPRSSTVTFTCDAPTPLNAVLSTGTSGVTATASAASTYKKMESLTRAADSYIQLIPDELHGVTCGSTAMLMHRTVRQSANLNTLSYEIVFSTEI